MKTKEEILEYSKRCAEFLSFEISENKECFKLPNKNGWIILDIFHSDWNWIHEVVEAIEGMGNDITIYHSHVILSYSEGEVIEVIECKTKKEAVVQAINQFLIWNNENKTN